MHSKPNSSSSTCRRTTVTCGSSWRATSSGILSSINGQAASRGRQVRTRRSGPAEVRCPEPGPHRSFPRPVPSHCSVSADWLAVVAGLERSTTRTVSTLKNTNPADALGGCGVFFSTERRSVRADDRSTHVPRRWWRSPPEPNDQRRRPGRFRWFESSVPHEWSRHPPVSRPSHATSRCVGRRSISSGESGAVSPPPDSSATSHAGRRSAPSPPSCGRRIEILRFAAWSG